jgi:kynureninase
MNQFSPERSLALDLDRTDPLSDFRDQFLIEDPDLIYLDGNSLGRLPKPAASLLQEAVTEGWGKRLIRGWNEGWFDLSSRLGSKLSKAVGAREGEVIICDSTSVNLFKLAAAALQIRPGRTQVISDVLNFPTDLYIIQGVIDRMYSGHRLDLMDSPDSLTIPEDALSELLGEETALVALTHVAYKSAFMYDMAAVTDLAHRTGALALWDLSHSAGAVELHLNEWGVDLAVGCTYKYLNGGPGSPAFLYVRKELQEELLSPLWGWFGTREPFQFNLEYEPGPGLQRFQVGTPPILSMLALEPGLDLILEAGVPALREKSLRLSEYLIYLFHEWLEPLGFQLGSPPQADQRGSHVSLRHPEGYRICRALIEPKEETRVRVIPDFRPPDNIRLGLAPLYTGYLDIHTALSRLRDIVSGELYRKYSPDRKTVT